MAIYTAHITWQWVIQHQRWKKNEMDLHNMQFMVWQIHAMSMRRMLGGRRMKDYSKVKCICGAKITEMEISCWYCNYRHANWQSRFDEIEKPR